MAHLITAKKEKSVWRFQIIKEMCDKRQIGSVCRTNEHLFTQNVQRLNFIFPFPISVPSLISFSLFSLETSKHEANSTIKYKNYDSTKFLSFMRLFLVWHCVCVCVARRNAHTFMNHLLFSLWKENRRTLVYLNRTPRTDGCCRAFTEDNIKIHEETWKETNKSLKICRLGVTNIYIIFF